MVSGSRGAGDITHAIEAGATDFVLKPLDRVSLASKLARHVDTEALREHRAEMIEPSGGRAPARLEFEVEISALDEIGIHLVSPHLVPKGTVLKIQADLWKELGLETGECLVSVVDTAYLPDPNLYSAYAEFEEPSPEFARELRRWLGKAA